jgi:hypothetical protein
VHGGIDPRVALANEVCLYGCLAGSDGHAGDGTTRPDGLQSAAGNWRRAAVGVAAAPILMLGLLLVYCTLAGAP